MRNRNSGSQASQTILLVDDEEAVLAHASRLIETFGMTVLPARSTAEALRMMGAVNIDAALLDWRLKGQDDGVALGRMLLREYGIPFVIFSGYLDTNVTGNAYRLGAADVVDKPLQPRRLLAALNSALRQKTRRKRTGDDVPPQLSSVSV